jgi:hypothetical protein
VKVESFEFEVFRLAVNLTFFSVKYTKIWIIRVNTIEASMYYFVARAVYDEKYFTSL